MIAAFVLGAMTAPGLCQSTGFMIRGCSCPACRVLMLRAGLRVLSDGPIWTVEDYAAQLGISREELLRIAGGLEIPR